MRIVHPVFPVFFLDCPVNSFIFRKCPVFFTDMANYRGAGLQYHLHIAGTCMFLAVFRFF